MGSASRASIPVEEGTAAGWVLEGAGLLRRPPSHSSQPCTEPLEPPMDDSIMGLAMRPPVRKLLAPESQRGSLSIFPLLEAHLQTPKATQLLGT